MSHPPALLRTERLVLRQWRDEDAEPWAAMNSDREVRAFFPGPLSRQQSDESRLRFQAHLMEKGWGLWAVERLADGEFVGMVGLACTNMPLPFGPCVEVGWRLARRWWGFGYATEAARVALAYGFGPLDLSEIVSFTSLLNRRSQAVMERLGMQRDREDFDHPAIESHHPLCRHCLYRLSRAAWRANL